MEDFKIELQNVERYIKIQKEYEESEKYYKKKGFSPLTKQESILVKDIAMGMSNIEIAKKVNLGKSTIAFHRKNINIKIGVSRPQLITLYAIKTNNLEL